MWSLRPQAASPCFAKTSRAKVREKSVISFVFHMSFPFLEFGPSFPCSTPLKQPTTSANRTDRALRRHELCPAGTALRVGGEQPPEQVGDPPVGTAPGGRAEGMGVGRPIANASSRDAVPGVRKRERFESRP